MWGTVNSIGIKRTWTTKGTTAAVELNKKIADSAPAQPEAEVLDLPEESPQQCNVEKQGVTVKQ